MNKILAIAAKDFVSLPEEMLKEFFGKTIAKAEKKPNGNTVKSKFAVAGYLSRHPVIFSEDKDGNTVSLSSSIRKAHLSGTRFMLINNSGIRVNDDWLFAYFGKIKNEEKMICDYLMDYIRSHTFKNPVLYLKDAFKDDIISGSGAAMALANDRYLFIFRGKNSNLKYTHFDEKWIFCSHGISGLNWKPVKRGCLIIVDKEAKLIDTSNNLPVEYLNNYTKVLSKPLPG